MNQLKFRINGKFATKLQVMSFIHDALQDNLQLGRDLLQGVLFDKSILNRMCYGRALELCVPGLRVEGL